MYDLNAYFTNDGTVGLFSKDDDDIYHSTYGALTESWEKFILPANLEDFLMTNDDVKILDICYGIGYNSKAALQVFVSNFLNKNLNLKTYSSKIVKPEPPNIEAIYTNNISERKQDRIFAKNQNCNNFSRSNIDQIDSDNITHLKNNGEAAQVKYFHKKILIDAVDIDKTLTVLSPFITRYKKNNLLLKSYIYNRYYKNSETSNKFAQIKKISKATMKSLNKKFKLNQETLMIIAMEMLNKDSDVFNDENLQSILSNKKYAPFLSKFMINFAKFYQNAGHKHSKGRNKSPFLHNIYYRYITRSYKNAKFILKNNKIDLNFANEDARVFINQTQNKYNFIFLDAFTPAKCPALWTLDFFSNLYSKLEENGMVLTYSNSAAIRNAFIKNGFSVGKVYDSKLQKFTGTIATKNEKLIDYPLDEHDMALINSKAGICFRDENLTLPNNEIIKNRNIEIGHSDLISSTKALKGLKENNVR